MIRLTRRYKFSASHRLHSPELGAEDNRRVYGKCNNPYGHGHDYVLDVSVRAPVDARTGLAVDVARLDRLVEDLVVRRFHLRNLNTDAAEFGQLVPTTENLAMVIERRLNASWAETFRGPWPVLETVRLEETRRNVFEVPVSRI